MLYDCHRAGEFAAGRNIFGYAARRRELADNLAKVSGYPHILLGDSFPADEPPIGGWQVLAQEYVRRGGYDGLILRDTRAPWQAGTARNGELIKVKPSVTLDLRCNGVIQGEGKHAGKLGAISVSFNGVNSCVGTGFSDDERDRFWRAAVREGAFGKTSEPVGTRTQDLRIKSPLLYQLSYRLKNSLLRGEPETDRQIHSAFSFSRRPVLRTGTSH